MNILNNRFALLVMLTAAQSTINLSEEFHAVTIGTLPGKIDFNYGLRFATKEEKEYARALAQRQLYNLNTSYLRRTIENVAYATQEVQDLTKEYVWDAQPFGIQHGGKALIIPFTIAVTYTVYKTYLNIPTYKNWVHQGWESCKQWNPYATYRSYKDAWISSRKTESATEEQSS